ncbi:MAG TPA: hypothetical protein VFI95_06820 [Terriglobales bacterium]|nr:hypothetical protein [Terriglobales bacterium]
MRNPYEVLSEKEVEIARLRKETAALRLVIDLIDDHDPDRLTVSPAQSSSQPSDRTTSKNFMPASSS